MRELVNSYSKTNSFGDNVVVEVYDDNTREVNTFINLEDRLQKGYLTIEEFEKSLGEEAAKKQQQSTNEHNPQL